jgi:4'-phosphopantetheinyl transferase
MQSGASLVLLSDALHLWRADLASADASQYLALLDPSEIARAERLRFAHLRQRFIAARGILRSILGVYQQAAPQTLQFQYQERGKPSLVNSRMEFNVSHSADMAVYIIAAATPVGIDIEIRKTPFDPAVARRYFHPAECAYLFALPEPEQAAAFYQIWARKEALIKAHGDGMHLSLTGFSTIPPGAGQPAPVEQDGSWLVHDFKADAAYQSAFATQLHAPVISTYEWTSAGAGQIAVF